MSQRNVLILERSNQNLKKMDDKGKTILEGIFAEFGIENRNGRIYEEREYLPHLEYLKKDMEKGSLLGELDHPERFEVALGNVSHRITELWYDQSNRQIKGRIEVLDTPKGQIAKSLLESGVPLSISSRAAGTVNEDKSVAIQQIYTYDLVAKPGFEAAELTTVNESAKARIGNQIKALNESVNSRNSHDISAKLGIINENVSILDLTDKFPSVTLRDEALALQTESMDSNVKNKNEVNQMKQELNENSFQQWTAFFKKELSNINERLDTFDTVSTATGNGKEVKLLKQYVEKMRKVQEDSISWTGDIAKAVNKVATYADSLAEKNNQHYTLTKKVIETVDENAKVLNHTQDWVGNNASVTNAIAETVDHNAGMLNGVNEWNTEIAKGVNELHEWGSEKAKAINGIHEWTSSVAKNLNSTVNWSEDMFGRAMSKDDAKKLVGYIESVTESSGDPKIKQKLDEALTIKGISIIDTVGKVGNSKVNVDTKKASGVEIDKNKTIVAKIGSGKFKKGAKHKALKTLDKADNSAGFKSSAKVKGIITLDTVKGKATPKVKLARSGAKTKNHNLKLNTKPSGSLKESKEINLGRSTDVKSRRSKLEEKLTKIMENVDKDRKIDESIKNAFPFTSLLNESDRTEFNKLSLSEKKMVKNTIDKNPTIDAGTIKALWENTINENNIQNSAETPLWLRAAPKDYKLAFENAPEALKEATKARSEFYLLETQYQIENFWQTSGVSIGAKKTSLNEVFTAATPDKSNQEFDAFVNQVGNQLGRYNK